MANIANGVPEGLHGASKVLSEPNSNLATTELVVVMKTEIFVQQFVQQMYQTFEYAASSQGGTLRFDERELYKYYISAIFARVQKTTLPDKRKHARGAVYPDVNQQWWIPDIMAYLVNQIGRVEAGPKDMVTYYPVWNDDLDELLLDRDQQQRISAAIRATSSLGVAMARGISSSYDGTPVVMTLTYFGEPGAGHWAYREPFRVSDAVESSLLGILRSADHASLPVDYWPPAILEESYVWHYLTEVAQFSVKS
jgi:hypothetical protein